MSCLNSNDVLQIFVSMTRSSLSDRQSQQQSEFSLRPAAGTTTTDHWQCRRATPNKPVTSSLPMDSNSSLATQGPSDDGPHTLALRRSRVDRALQAASSPLNDVTIDTTTDDQDVKVRVTTLGPSIPRPPTSAGTPKNSQVHSFVGLQPFSCLDVCCSAEFTKPTGRDGIEQIHVFFHRELLELSACEHKRVFMINADGQPKSSSLLSSCINSTPNGDRSLSVAESTAATELGKQLTESAFLTSNQIQLIVVSPLRRALQTALKLFPIGTHQIPFLVTPFLMELESAASGSAGSNSSQLQRDFPEFQFDLPEDWWITDFDPHPHDETPVSIKYRINELTSMLLHRSELQIVIVGHTKFLARWSKRPVMKQLEIKTFELCAD